MTFNRAHAPAGSSKGIREHAAAMKSHGLRLRGKQTVAARPALAAMASVPPFVEGARMPSLAARPDAKAAKAAAPTGASTPCAGGGPRVEGGCRGPDVAEVRFIVIFYFIFFFIFIFIYICMYIFLRCRRTCRRRSQMTSCLRERRAGRNWEHIFTIVGDGAGA